MGINIGSKELVDAKLGNKQIKEIYLGNNLLWPTKRSVQEVLDKNLIPKPRMGTLFDGNVNSCGEVSYWQAAGTFNYVDGFEGHGKKAWSSGSTSNCIKLGSEGNAITNQVTISCVVCPTSHVGSNQGILGGLCGANGQWGGGYALYTIPASPTVTFQAYFGNGGGNRAYSIGVTSEKLVLNKWTHIIAKFYMSSAGSANLYLYINGKEYRKSGTQPSTRVYYNSFQDQVSEAYIRFGHAVFPSWSWQPFYGYIQDFLFWNKDLSSSELKPLMDYYRSVGLYT